MRAPFARPHRSRHIRTLPATGHRCSGVGELCARQLAHRAAGTKPSNVPDPLRALIGTGVHSAIAGLIDRLNAGSGRFLVEHPVRYRGVPGTVDLFDRLTGTVVDWKTAHLAKLRHVQQSGPPSHYVVQLQIYGAALAAAGETVRALALAYVPLDGTLDELWVWRTTPDPRAADAAINRLNAIVGAELESVARPDPSTVEASPSALCRCARITCPAYAARRRAVRARTKGSDDTVTYLAERLVLRTCKWCGDPARVRLVSTCHQVIFCAMHAVDFVEQRSSMSKIGQRRLAKCGSPDHG